MYQLLWERKSRLRIVVKVKPNSNISEIVKKDSMYIAYLKSLPIENKANIELITLLSTYFNVAKSNVIIKRGKTSNLKLIEIL